LGGTRGRNQGEKSSWDLKRNDWNLGGRERYLVKKEKDCWDQASKKSVTGRDWVQRGGSIGGRTKRWRDCKDLKGRKFSQERGRWKG